jgi:hypothetical protein
MIHSFASFPAALAFLLVFTFPTTFIAESPQTSRRQDPRLSSVGRLARRHVAATRAGQRTTSSGCFNEPDCETEVPLSALQAETTIAVDATGQHVVVGFNDFRGFQTNPTQVALSISGYMYSDDGGKTFVDGGQLPSPGTDILGGQRYPQVFGDPDVKWITGCTFVYSSIGIEKYGTDGLVQSIVFHRSNDCGHTWDGPFSIPPTRNPNGVVDVNHDAVDAADKELTDVDPDTGRYMVCWSNFTPFASGGVEISCTYSDDVPSTIPTFAPRRLVAARRTDGQGSSVRFAGRGSANAIVAWTSFTSYYTNRISYSRSTDNGATWGAPIDVTSNFVTMDQVLGNDRVNTNPSVAIDLSPGPFANNVYVVYSNNNSRDGADVAFLRSTDGGATFGPLVLLNSRPGADRAQWFPFVTVDRMTGRVWVFYYDQGIDTSGDLTEVTYTFSDDGGVTWTRPATLTERPFNAGWGNDTGQPNLGDYIQSVANLGSFWGSYAAGRQLGFADGQPSTAMTVPDAEVTVTSSAKAAIAVGTLAYTDSGGNGAIDPGEQVVLQIPLRNYVTNPLNAAPASGVTATLSTATPSVEVEQGSSAYPDIAPGATASNSTSYELHVLRSFVAGTPIELLLEVTTADGSIMHHLTLQSGTPVYTTLLHENFERAAPGTLPTGWTSSHGGGPNVVPWTTSASFCGSSNKAFHQEANDVPGATTFSRWERLFSPVIAVPSTSSYVSVDFDVCYDTEDDPVLPRLAYDGLFLRVTDLTPGRTLRSVLAEAFEREFTTDSFKHYPKHFPRNFDPAYFEDMSAWAGDSHGMQHVHMMLPGMAGSRFQLRLEYTQDQIATCQDVRPGHTCGVAIDNIVIRNAVAVAQSSIRLTLTESLARDATTNEVVATITATNASGSPVKNAQIDSAVLGTTSTTSALPVVLGDIGSGQSAIAIVRFPGSAGAAGISSVLRLIGSYKGGTFAGSFPVIVP